MARKSGFNVKVSGVSEALKRAGSVREQLIRELDEETGKAALRVVNDAKKSAPRKSGALKNSIDIYEEDKMTRVVGSDKPYAQRQEYEHATQKGFFRNALWRERSVFRDNIKAILRKIK
jgi:hypothetical protein